MKAYSLNPDDSNISGLGALDALLTRGADPMSQDSMGGTALSYLVETWEKHFLNYTDITRGLGYDVAEIAAIVNKIVDSTKNKDCLTSVCKDPHLLFLALVAGEEDLAYKVLRHCPSVDEKAYRISRLSSLEAACCYGWCSRQLLEEVLRASKVDRSAASTKYGLLLCACEERPYDMGIRPYNMKRAVEDLLDLGFNPNDSSVEGKTAMMSAAKGGHVAIVELLIYHGADVAATDNRGWSVIHYACQSGNGRLLYSLKRVMSNWNARITTKLHDNWSYNATALHLAAALDGYALEFLLANDLISDINSLTHNRETALWIAAYFGISRNVSLLLDENADDTIQAWHTESPLHVALRCGHLEVVNIFINKGCDLLLQDGKGRIPELLARKYGHHDIANVLKEKISARVMTGRHTMIMEKNQSASKPLKLAIELGDVELCRALVEEGVNTDSDFPDFGGDTPVLYAFAHGQLEIAEYLISNDASVAGAIGDKSICRGYTPFHYAATAGKTQILRMLFEKAPQGILRCCQPVHPIHLAVASGHAECVELIINHAREVEGAMLLDHVCGGSYDLDHVIGVPVLGADFLWLWRLTSTLHFSQMGLDTAKPLHIAASLGRADIARSLIEHGASVDSVDDKLWTPLHFAADQGQTQLTEVLIHSNANVNAVDDTLESPCMVAASRGFLQPIQALIQGGADLTLKDRDYSTALHRAAISGYVDIVSFLVTNMEDYALNAETLYGESVLSVIACWAYPSHSSFFLNLAPRPSIYEPRKSNVLTAVAGTNVPAHLKKVLRQLPKELVPKLMAHRAIEWGTPLYAAATKPAAKVIDMLLDAGAELELEGGEHGTPLMGACATGRLGVVKTFVRKGAKTSYTKDNRVFSALSAAKHHPNVIRWLLVGRFTEGPLLIENGES